MKLGFLEKYLPKHTGVIKKKPLYNPHRDWKIMIGIFLATLLLLIGTHYLVYKLAENGVLFVKTAEEEKFRAVLRRAQVEETIEVFEARIKQNTLPREQREVLQDPVL